MVYSDIESVKEQPDSMSEEPDVGKYVLIKFTTGKTIQFYISLIIKYKPDEKCYTVKYLRKIGNGVFSWPIADDISDVTRLDIQDVLSKPQVGRRGELKFILNHLNVPINNIR